MSSSDQAGQKNLAPIGLRKLIDHYQELYPDQLNPLQVTTVLKYWLGGQDPLDYISMFHNPGDASQNIPPHWHYVSFGLSDLHGDGRVHVKDNTPTVEPRSGMGFELTFRLSKTSKNVRNIDKPPTWPANLLQAIARYVFQTGNRLCVGDNIPWRKSLDNVTSNIQHMLIAQDPQLKRLETPYGTVDFCQIVGVTEEELKQASRWNGKGVLDILAKDPTTGGAWLITDMMRSQSVFKLFPDTLKSLEADLEQVGSDLAGINAFFTFKEIVKTKIKSENSDDTKKDLTDSNELLKRNKFINNIVTQSLLSINNSLNSSIMNQGNAESQMVMLDGLELTVAPDAAKFLMLAIKDRIRHGKHFTFKSQYLSLTFVAESVTGASVTKESPFGILGYWMQVLITDDLVSRMIESFKDIDNDNIILPKVFDWPDKNFKIIIDSLPELLP